MKDSKPDPVASPSSPASSSGDPRGPQPQPQRKRITSQQMVESVRPEEKRFELLDDKVKGLRLRVSPDGTKAWSFAFRGKITGKSQRVSLGRFSPGATDHVSLPAARKKAEAAKVANRKAATAPIPKRAKAGEKADALKTVGETLNEYLKHRVDAPKKLRPETLAGYKGIADRAGRYFKGVLVASLDEKEVREWLKSLMSATRTVKAPDGSQVELPVKGYSANRSLEVLRQAMRWALEKGTIKVDPTAKLKDDVLAEETQRLRALDLKETRALLIALGQLTDEGLAGEGGANADAVRLLLLTAKRKSGVLGLRRSELKDIEGDEPSWSLPADREKNKKPHEVQLSPQAMRIIERRIDAAETRRASALADAVRLGGSVHPTVGTFLFAADQRANKKDSRWYTREEKPKAEVPGHFLSRLKRRVEEVRGETVEPWCLHSLRSTFATLSDGFLGVSPETISEILSHASANISTQLGYNLATHKAARRDALTRWGAFLDDLADGTRSLEEVLASAKSPSKDSGTKNQYIAEFILSLPPALREQVSPHATGGATS